MIEIGNIVWYKLDMFSDWKVGKVVSFDDKEFYNVQRMRVSKDKSELSDTIVRVHKKLVEQLLIHFSFLHSSVRKFFKPLIQVIRRKSKNKSKYFVVVRDFSERIIAKRKFSTRAEAVQAELDLRKQLSNLKDGNVKFFLIVWSD